MSFTVSFAYDLLGDTSSITYPTCTFTECVSKDVARTVNFNYTNGFRTSVQNAATGAYYASAITYWPNLMVNQVTHGNGVVDAQANDPNAMRRPQSITSTSTNGMPITLWKTDNYVYDGTGNITQIGAARFLYDPVSRLTSGSLVLGPLDNGAETYAFDAFGNIQTIGGSIIRNTPGTVWHGAPGSTPGTGQWNYRNASTRESFRPDLNHSDPTGPHWDYRAPNGAWYRIMPDDTVNPK